MCVEKTYTYSIYNLNIQKQPLNILVCNFSDHFYTYVDHVLQGKLCL